MSLKNKSLDLMIRMDLIKEQTQKVLENNINGILTEMAYPRKKVKERIDNLFPQIIENWCLVHYVTLSGDKEIYKNHWKNELLTHLSNVARIAIKDNDSFDSRKCVVNEIIIENDYTLPSVIDFVIFNKFRKENINTKDKIYGNVINDFISNVSNIVNLISNKNRDEITEYVENI